MSQFFTGITGSNLPSNIPTSFTTDVSDSTILTVPVAASGSAVPVANILRVSGDDGISTVNTPNVPGNLTVRFIQGEISTTDATPTTIITQATNNNSTFTTQIIVAAYDTVNNVSMGAYVTAVITNVAGTATNVGTIDFIKNADPTMTTATLQVTFSGANFNIQAVGIAGRNITWKAVLPGIATAP